MQVLPAKAGSGVSASSCAGGRTTSVRTSVTTSVTGSWSGAWHDAQNIGRQIQSQALLNFDCRDITRLLQISGQRLGLGAESGGGLGPGDERLLERRDAKALAVERLRVGPGGPGRRFGLAVGDLERQDNALEVGARPVERPALVLVEGVGAGSGQQSQPGRRKTDAGDHSVSPRSRARVASGSAKYSSSDILVMSGTDSCGSGEVCTSGGVWRAA